MPSAGTLSLQLVIPNTAPLAGQILHQQIVPLDLGALGNLTALTSTNALTLTLGAF